MRPFQWNYDSNIHETCCSHLEWWLTVYFGKEAKTYTDRNSLVNFLQVVIYLVSSSKHLAWNMGEKCLASELLYIKTILLVWSNFFSKVLKQYLFQVKQFLSQIYEIQNQKKKSTLVKKVQKILLLLSNHLPRCK